MIRWHIAMVRPNQEKRVVAEMVGLTFKAIWPRFVRQELVGGARHRWRGRERMETVERSAYPNYIVFASGPPWQDLRKIEEVTRILRAGGDRERAAVVPDRLLIDILGPAGDGILPEREKKDEALKAVREFVRDQEIAIRLGSSDRRGVVIEVDRGRLKIEVDGRELSVPADVVTAA